MQYKELLNKEAKLLRKKLLIKIVIIMIVALFAVTFVPRNINAATATITPGNITGEKPENPPKIGEDFLSDITSLIRTIGMFIAVGAMMVIGIKYMTGSVEEKANYKKTMMPYLVRMCTTIWSVNTSTDDNKYIFRCTRYRTNRKCYFRSDTSSRNICISCSFNDTWNQIYVRKYGGKSVI